MAIMGRCCSEARTVGALTACAGHKSPAVRSKVGPAFPASAALPLPGTRAAALRGAPAAQRCRNRCNIRQPLQQLRAM
jgi:hypothetical protein